MCKIIKKISEEKVTGYKIAYQVGKKYYSPVTGIEYKPGNVEIPTTYGKNNIRNQIRIANVLDKSSLAHDARYSGKTAVFMYHEDAIEHLHDWRSRSSKRIKFAILEMELSGELYDGEYYFPVYLGTVINSIKKVKNKIKLNN
jgi:hypothetical protein